MPMWTAYGLDKVELVYKKMKGWKEDISKARTFEELPANAQSYVKMIEEVRRRACEVDWGGS